jgi:hypothetical protein
MNKNLVDGMLNFEEITNKSENNPETLRNEYISIVNELSSNKKPNQEALEERLKVSGTKAIKGLTILTLEQDSKGISYFCRFLESFQNYFANGYETTKNITPYIEEYKNFGEQVKKKYFTFIK